MACLLLLSVPAGLAEEGSANAGLAPLSGISVGMKGKHLLDNWGFPIIRDRKTKEEVWFYLNQNTSNPTDGVVVYLDKEKISSWRMVDNIYSEMNAWGKGAGVSR